MKHCENCGAENNDDAGYCIKCGNKLGKKSSKSAKRKNLKWILPVVLLGVVALAIGAVRLYPVFLKTDTDVITEDKGTADKDTAEDTQAAVVSPAVNFSETITPGITSAESTPGNGSAINNESTTGNDSESDGESTSDNSGVPGGETAVAPGSWHNSTESHDITINSILKYDGNAIFNFNDTVAVGVYGQNGVISTAETESGFILSVIDEDSVKVTFYNNGTEYIVPTQLLAEMSAEDYIDETGATEYIIDSYGDCSDGFGLIQMTLSNGRIVCAGVLRENGQLYAANYSTKPAIAENNVDFRLKMEPILEASNITPDNQTYTDPIYYPIVPVAANERTDVDFWVNQANELVQDDWTDAHKVKVFYDYIIDNFAYDYWVISHTDANSRTFYHKDYTGTHFTSNTHVGICEDFANILAIMCRAQNIPATKIDGGNHAWTYVYIADYGRWMTVDVTTDLAYGCYSEDVTEWTSLSNKRYANFDNVSGSKFASDCNAGIGNRNDMERYGKIPVEQQ